MLGRVEIESHDVDPFLDEVRVVAHFEGPTQVWLQPVGSPDPADHRTVRAQRFGEAAGAPVSGISGLLLRHRDDLVDQFLACPGRSPTTGCVSLDPGDAALGEAIAPAAHRGAGDTEFHGDVLVLPAIGGKQDDAGPLDQSSLGTASPGPMLQGRSILVCQRDCAGASHRHILLS